MKYYFDSKREDVKNLYITEVTINESEDNKTYTITYANGEVEDNVEYTDSNAEKIDKRLNKQFSKGNENSYKLSKKQKLGSIGSITAGVVLGSASIYAMTTTAVTDNPSVIVGIAGAIVLGGVILGIKNYKHYQSILTEMDEIGSRLENTEVSRQYLQTSPNSYRALDGDSEDEKIARAGEIFDMFLENHDPFSLLSLETGTGLTNEEVSRLVLREKREKNLGLTYMGGYSFEDVAKQYTK